MEDLLSQPKEAAQKTSHSIEKPKQKEIASKMEEV